jgi:hypothetical protein
VSPHGPEGVFVTQDVDALIAVLHRVRESAAA